MHKDPLVLWGSFITRSAGVNYILPPPPPLPTATNWKVGLGRRWQKKCFQGKTASTPLSNKFPCGTFRRPWATEDCLLFKIRNLPDSFPIHKEFHGSPSGSRWNVSEHSYHKTQGPFAKTSQAVWEERVLDPYYVQGEQTPPWWSILILLEMLALALPGRRGASPFNLKENTMDTSCGWNEGGASQGKQEDGDKTKSTTLKLLLNIFTDRKVFLPWHHLAHSPTQASHSGRHHSCGPCMK